MLQNAQPGIPMAACSVKMDSIWTKTDNVLYFNRDASHISKGSANNVQTIVDTTWMRLRRNVSISIKLIA